MTYSAVQMKQARLELRVTQELLDAIDVARGDVSRTRWVERALEKALGPESQDAPVSGAVRPVAPPRMSVPKIAGVETAADLLAAKQARMNAERAKKK